MPAIGATVMEPGDLGRVIPPSPGTPAARQADTQGADAPLPDPSSMTDGDLVTSTLAGRRECFAELVVRYTDVVATFALGRTGSRELAEEVAQEAMVRAFEGLWGLRAPRRFSSWLLGIARNVTARMMEDRARTVNVEADEMPAPEVPGSPGISADDRRRILEEVEALDEHYRVVFVLMHQMKLSCAQIADRLALPEGTVRSRLSRAYTILKTKLRGSGEAGS